MGFAEEFLEKLTAQKQRYDVWNAIITDMDIQTKRSLKLEKENAKLNKIIQGTG